MEYKGRFGEWEEKDSIFDKESNNRFTVFLNSQQALISLAQKIQQKIECELGRKLKFVCYFWLVMPLWKVRICKANICILHWKEIKNALQLSQLVDLMFD